MMRACTRRRSPQRRIALLLPLVLPLAGALAIFGCGGDAVEADRSSGSGAAAAARGGPPGSGGDGTGTRFGYGTPADPSDIARWDIDVGPDGEGLPPGSGTATAGAEVYRVNCARCHGETGVEGPNTVLVAAEPQDSFSFGVRPDLRAAIGNYWPYATTVFDYVRRSMPFDAPGSLTDDEVYSVTAWLLWRNELVEADEVVDAASLPRVSMPARPHFVVSEDVRLDALP